MLFFQCGQNGRKSETKEKPKNPGLYVPAPLPKVNPWKIVKPQEIKATEKKVNPKAEVAVSSSKANAIKIVKSEPPKPTEKKEDPKVVVAVTPSKDKRMKKVEPKVQKAVENVPVTPSKSNPMKIDKAEPTKALNNKVEPKVQKPVANVLAPPSNSNERKMSSSVDYNGTRYYNVGALIRRQIEYYFSPTNLIRDTYLKSIMDSEGFVDVQIIASFPLISQYSVFYTALIPEILKAIMGSEELELRNNKVRTRNCPTFWPKVNN